MTNVGDSATLDEMEFHLGKTLKKLYLTVLAASYWNLCDSFDLVLLSADMRYCSGMSKMLFQTL